jgi:hypothetical protein
VGENQALDMSIASGFTFLFPSILIRVLFEDKEHHGSKEGRTVPMLPVSRALVVRRLRDPPIAYATIVDKSETNPRMSSLISFLSIQQVSYLITK